MHKPKSAQFEIERLLFELNCCVTDLSRHRLQISLHDIQQIELSLSRLGSLISFAKQFETQQIAC